MQNQIDNDFKEIKEETKVHEKDSIQEKTLVSSKTIENIINLAYENSPEKSKILPEVLIDADIKNDEEKDVLDFFH